MAASLLDNKFRWEKPSSLKQKKLMRQQVWCLLAWANNRHEESDLTAVDYVLTRVRSIVDELLIDQTFPCYGTLYHVWHLEGLLRRDEGDLDQALKAFTRALHFARARLEENILRHENDTKRLQDEHIYFKVCQARTMGFGFGEIEFLRGDFFRAEAFFTLAGQVFGEEVAGFPRWPKLIQLYLLGCRISVTRFESDDAISAFKAAGNDLKHLKSELEALKVHRDYTRLAQAFHGYALMRSALARLVREGKASFPTLVGKVPELIEEIENWVEMKNDLGTGPVARLTARLYAEIAVRTLDESAGKTVAISIEHNRNFALFQLELKLIEVEHLMLLGQHDAAAGKVLRLQRRPQIDTRQRIWLKLLAVSCGESTDDFLGEPNTESLIDDSYLFSYFESVRGEIAAGRYRLPFQLDESDESLNLDANSEALTVALVKLAWRRGHGVPKEIAKICGRRTAWWSEMKERYAKEPWFRSLMSNADKRTKPRKWPKGTDLKQGGPSKT